MALLKKNPKEIPSDAVILTQDEAYAYQWKLIEGWHNKSEIWSLRYGPGIFSAISAISGIYVNNYYRTKLKLGNYGKLSSYLPIVALPAIMSGLYHKGFIQKSIVLDSDVCPVCIQLDAASFQIGFGVIYPTILAPFSAFMFATRHYTFRLPSITEKPKEVFKLWFKMTRPLTNTLGIAIIGHGLFAMYLTYKEMEQYYKLQMAMQKLEERYDNQ